ncbi:hypothetical protein PF008_g12864 [Phytophthora fragariae]|uniref:Secreted protein n=1 Tax=Phytophthora fragariae TaxID=53985 RepID=A0A6G0RLR7_9STRA|nr:hypothetical protein PF008_g12864 [Phytophthora fragariae]
MLLIITFLAATTIFTKLGTSFVCIGDAAQFEIEPKCCHPAGLQTTLTLKSDSIWHDDTARSASNRFPNRFG